MNMENEVKKLALGVLRHLPRTRQLVRRKYWKRNAAKYDALARKTPTNEKLVLFSTFMGRSYGCSPRAVYEWMRSSEAYEGYEFVWIFREEVVDRYRDLPEFAGARIVVRSTREYYETLAEAKYWVVNARVPEYVTPKDDQVYVQCWHGTPLKRLGYDVTIETTNALNTTDELAGRFGLDSKKWSYLVSPSPYASEHLASAFGLPEERRSDVVLEIGYPRNDAIVNACSTPQRAEESRERLVQKLGIPQGKKLLLYAPTWRDSEYKAGLGYVQESLIDFDLLHRELQGEWVILFRPHYYIANEFDFGKYGGFVFNAAAVEDINELYIVADALLTDYSSVFFDYACTKRPLLFYWPDFESYANDIRGFYFDPRTLPGPQCETTREVVEALGEVDSYFDRYGEGYQRFLKTFCPLEDGEAAKRLVEAMLR